MDCDADARAAPPRPRPRPVRPPPRPARGSAVDVERPSGSSCASSCERPNAVCTRSWLGYITGRHDVPQTIDNTVSTGCFDKMRHAVRSNGVGRIG